MIGGERFERLVAMVDVDDENVYVIDVFRVKGGARHTNFFHSTFGDVTTNGLELAPGEPFSGDTQMQNFQTDVSPEPGWSIDWKVSDPYGYVSADRDIHVRYTNLTDNATATLAEGWVDVGLYGSESRWLPRVYTERKSDAAPLASTFVSIIEPYEGSRLFELITRTAPPVSASEDQQPVSIVLKRADGLTDVFLYGPSQTQSELTAPDAQITATGELVHVTLSNTGPVRASLWNVSRLTAGDWELNVAPDAGYLEVDFSEDRATVVSGDRGAVRPALPSAP
ncbi:MAG: hypothetical protein KJ060_21595, partial [Candidatus Hydrogenedentes bacterium]|nr:hypothetical protein [Candidatus Hydrogenedentota bacterium]